jgi:hypothetical protein
MPHAYCHSLIFTLLLIPLTLLHLRSGARVEDLGRSSSWKEGRNQEQDQRTDRSNVILSRHHLSLYFSKPDHHPTDDGYPQTDQEDHQGAQIPPTLRRSVSRHHLRLQRWHALRHQLETSCKIQVCLTYVATS